MSINNMLLKFISDWVSQMRFCATFSKPHAELLSNLVEYSKTATVIYSQSMHRALKFELQVNFFQNLYRSMNNQCCSRIFCKRHCALSDQTFSNAHITFLVQRCPLQNIRPKRPDMAAFSIAIYIFLF